MPGKKEKWYEKEIPGEIVFPILAFAVMFIYTIIITNIPNFIQDLYTPPIKEYQPFSVFIEKYLAVPLNVLSGIFAGLYSLFYIYAGTDFFATIFYSITILLNPTMMASVNLSTSTALQNILIMIALLTSHQVVYEIWFRAYSWKWFVALILSWSSILFALLFNLDCIGIFASILLKYFYFIFDKTVYLPNKRGQSHSFTSHILHFLKSFLSIFGSAAPLVFLAFQAYTQIPTPFHVEYIPFSYIFEEIIIGEKWSLMILISISILAMIFFPIQPMHLFPSIGLILGIIATLFIPFETQGESLARKVHFSKILLFLIIGLLVGSFENDWHARAFTVVLTIVYFIQKIVTVRTLPNEPIQPPQFQQFLNL